MITGATGFIGRYLVQEAYDNEFEIYISIRESSNYSHLEHLGVKPILIDFSTLESTLESFMRANCAAFDLVIHNAGVTNVFSESDFKKFNVDLTEYLCKALQELNLLNGQFVYISSIMASGPGDSVSLAQITEDQPSRPISAYGRSKLLAEQRIEKSGLTYLILRPTAVYGRGTEDFKDLVNGIRLGVSVYFNTTTQLVSFIHAHDLAQICFECVDKGLHNDIFLISDGNRYSIAEFNKIVKKSCNAKVYLNIRVPHALVRLSGYVQNKLRITSPMNSVDRANELLALNWHCRSTKLFQAIDYAIQHDLAEIIHHD